MADVDPWALAVSPRHFGEHLDVLTRYFRPMRLEDLDRSRRAEQIPAGAVVVTFDDGYADTLLEAVPLLEQHAVPATAFVTTGTVGAQAFWWDELETAILHADFVPPLPDVIAAMCQDSWETAAGDASRDVTPEARRGWRVWQLPPSSRHALLERLWTALRDLPAAQQEFALAQVRSWAATTSTAPPAHRPLSAPELGRLAGHPLVELGAHTVTHPRLAALPVQRQQAEIRQSKAWLEEVAGRRVTSFAYPYGGPKDYTEITVGLVREAGFTRACSNIRAPMVRSSDPFQLPRLSVHDCSGDSFARALARWVPLKRHR